MKVWKLLKHWNVHGFSKPFDRCQFLFLILNKFSKLIKFYWPPPPPKKKNHQKPKFFYWFQGEKKLINWLIYLNSLNIKSKILQRYICLWLLRANLIKPGQRKIKLYSATSTLTWVLKQRVSLLEIFLWRKL